MVTSWYCRKLIKFTVFKRQVEFTVTLEFTFSIQRNEKKCPDKLLFVRTSLLFEHST